MRDSYYLKVGRASDLKKSGEQGLYRFFEILPGALSWLTLISALILSWLLPIVPAVFIIFFVVFWFLRTVYFSLFLRSGYRRMSRNEKIDWLAKLKEEYKDKWLKIYHLVVLPTYKEPIEVVRGTFLALQKSDYPKDKIIIVLSGEERAKEHFEEISSEIKKEFGKIFLKLFITLHPSNIVGELQGHGANDAWATKQAKKEIIDSLKIPYENVIVSCLDVDTAVSPKYFSCLTYKYLGAEKPLRSSFQPIPLYFNNIWQAPVLSQIFSFSSTFWQMMCQERPEKLISFSSHALSLKVLDEVGYKQTNVVSDDSRLFWQAFFAFTGDYRTEPLFYPVSMDANVAKSFFRTMVNVYKQQRRWAYGVAEIPYFLFASLKDKKIAFFKKISLGLELIFSHWTWATSSLLIFLLGWLPIVLGGPNFSQTILSYSLPKLTSRVLTVSTFGLIASAYLSLTLLPPLPSGSKRFRYFIFAFGWILLPAIMIFFTALPALDAQTRLMLGKYMGFWVTEKVRKPAK